MRVASRALRGRRSRGRGGRKRAPQETPAWGPEAAAAADLAAAKPCLRQRRRHGCRKQRQSAGDPHIYRQTVECLGENPRLPATSQPKMIRMN